MWRSRWDTTQVLGVAGALLLLLGLLLPFVTTALAGTHSFLQLSVGGAIVVAAMAVMAAGVAAGRRPVLLLVPGSVAVTLLGATAAPLRNGAGGVANGALRVRIEDKSLGAMVQGMLDGGGADLEWGAAVLVTGAVLVLVAGLLAARNLQG